MKNMAGSRKAFYFIFKILNFKKKDENHDRNKESFLLYF